MKRPPLAFQPLSAAPEDRPPRSGPAHERRDRDLVAAVRAELAGIEPTRACCRLAERAGLGAAALGEAHSPVIARLAVRLPGTTHPRAFEWGSAREHCRVAYLRGVFLVDGSLSLSGGQTHLEFVMAPDEAQVLVARLADLGLPASWRLRRGQGVVIWKSVERVLNFLRLTGARGSVLELESRLITRSLQGHLNRVLNAEGYNLARSVTSASRHLEQIDRLERAGLLLQLPQLQRDLARLRREAPEATFTELADWLGISRARVQRAFQALEAAASSDGSAMR